MPGVMTAKGNRSMLFTHSIFDLQQIKRHSYTNPSKRWSNHDSPTQGEDSESEHMTPLLSILPRQQSGREAAGEMRWGARESMEGALGD